MSSLAVVTFTDGSRPLQLDRCISSVATDLPSDAVHHVIPTTGYANYAQQRLQALTLADYVCFVDDDDTVTNGSITKCYQAMEANDVGVVFTDEALVDATGHVLSTRVGQRTYEECAIKPWLIHHLVMFNSKHVTGDLSGLYGRITGVDHLIVLTALNSGGALHVPQIGYNWTQTPTSLSHRVNYVTLPNVPVSRSGPIPSISI